MDQIKIEIIQKPNVDPIKFVANSTRLNFKTNDDFFINSNLNNHDDKDLNIITNLIKCKHSPLEHCSYSILISGASRAFLAQVTRSRIGISYSSGSQHYSNWKKPDFVVPIEIFEKCEELNSIEPLKDFFNICNKAHDVYQEMQNQYKLTHDVTRAVTPQAMRNNLLITANIRTLLNLIALRICFRNTTEIRYITYKIREALVKECPEIFKLSGPNCFCTGKCSESKLTCGKPWKNFNDPQEERWNNLYNLGNKWRSLLSK